MSEPRRPRVVATPLPGGSEPLPDDVDPARLRRRALGVIALLGMLVLAALLAPGLGEVRDRIEHARPGWLVLAVVLEGLSCASYAVMFRPVFCNHMSRRTSWEIAWAELGVGSLVPASGAGGLALGAWILRRGGMPADKIARRSVAFFLIKSSVNFVAVAVVGVLMAAGAGPHRSPFLTLLPAGLSVLVIVAVLLLPRLGHGREPGPDAPKLMRAAVATRRAVVGGTAEAVRLLRTGDPRILGGALGYWAFDNAVLWATFHAFGLTLPLTVVLMGYLIGQLGGLLPLPGGVGGIDGGLIGTLVVYGAPAAATTAAVLAYRIILFWLPLLGGAAAFASLRRELAAPQRPDVCTPRTAT